MLVLEMKRLLIWLDGFVKAFANQGKRGKTLKGWFIVRGEVVEACRRNRLMMADGLKAHT